MRVFVTGGAGFIGSWTVEALIAAGHEVLVFDSLVTGRREYLRSALPPAVLVQGEITDALAVQRAVRRFRPEAILHLAACVSVPLSLRRPLRTERINTQGTLAVLEAARLNRVARFVFASSAAVYGQATSYPIAEESVLQPQSPYALQKLVNEEYARMYASLYGLETIGLRYFNVFGPRQDPASPYCGVISIFAKAMSDGQRVTIFGDGTQTRDFLFVADVARVNVAALTTPLSGHHVLNVGTGRETSLLELCQALETISGRQVPYTLGPARAGDIYRSCARVSSLQVTLGSGCHTTLLQGLRTLLEQGAQRT